MFVMAGRRLTHLVLAPAQTVCNLSTENTEAVKLSDGWIYQIVLRKTQRTRDLKDIYGWTEWKSCFYFSLVSAADSITLRIYTRSGIRLHYFLVISDRSGERSSTLTLIRTGRSVVTPRLHHGVIIAFQHPADYFTSCLLSLLNHSCY